MKLKVSIIMAVLIVALGTPWAATAGDLVIIVNAENPVTELSPETARKYLLKENLSWPNGKKVRSADRKGS
ncbi:MAG: hypothetical protein ACE5GK_12690, partial [Nitrospiria bacterium]